MNREDRPEKISIKETLVSDWPILLILLGTFIMGIVLYPSLPSRIPMHWNINGVANRYADKSLYSVFILPLISVGMYVFFLLLPVIDPNRRNYSTFMGSYRTIKLAAILFLSGIYVVRNLISVGYPIHMNILVRLGLGIMFIVMGNAMTRIRHNYFVGIRTPWTLANPEVWRKTHRLGGYVFVVAGIVVAISTFISGPAGAITVITTLVMSTIITALYSYIIFNKITKS